MERIILLFSLLFSFTSLSQLQTPLEQNNFSKLTSYEELISFLELISEKTDFINLEYIGESVENRKIPAVKISSGTFGEDTTKIKILVFAQQHGNEQSGKEGALLLLKKFASNEFVDLLDRMDVLIVPQVNPDGSEKNVRRNANDADLNRDHLTLLQPETTALHKLFNKFLPEVTLDVHEYYPFSESWEKYGYRKDFDEQFGTTTNINVTEKIRDYSKNKFLPFAESYLNRSGYSFHNYMVGGPPAEERLRFSTVDINDGRQSLGILNSFSFILEGKNGRDSIDNIKRRAEGQSAAIQALLRFVYENKDEIKILVNKERNKLINSAEPKKVSIRMDHFPEDGLEIKFRSVHTGEDTLITINNFHTEVRSLLDINKPSGYLISESDKVLRDWMDRHNIKYDHYEHFDSYKIEQYEITGIDSIYLEELFLPDVKVIKKEVQVDSGYLFVPVNQLHSNMLVLALEPQSMLGLYTYSKFNYLLNESRYPIYRVLMR